MIIPIYLCFTAAGEDHIKGHRAGAKVAVLQATKSDAVEVEERDRSLGEPPSLPAQPSLLSMTTAA